MDTGQCAARHGAMRCGTEVCGAVRCGAKRESMYCVPGTASLGSPEEVGVRWMRQLEIYWLKTGKCCVVENWQADLAKTSCFAVIFFVNTLLKMFCQSHLELKINVVIKDNLSMLWSRLQCMSRLQVKISRIHSRVCSLHRSGQNRLECVVETK